MKHIDIIGAGISGMATAYFLNKSLGNSVKIRVWEKDPYLGGLAGTFKNKDYTVEKFYHHIFRRDTALLDLIQEIGLGADIVWRPAVTGSYYFNQPYRLSSPLDLLRFRPLPFLSRIRLGMMVLHARTVKDWTNLDDTTVKDYILKYGGEKAYEIVWKPLLEGKFGAYSDNISAAWLWSKLADRGSSRNSTGFELFAYLKGGLGRVFQGIREELKKNNHEIITSTAVLRMTGDNNGIKTIQTSDGKELQTDFVVGAVHTPELAALLPDVALAYKNKLSKIDYLANVCLVLTLNKSLSQFYWTNVTDTSTPFVGIIEQTKWVENTEYNQKHIVYISAYITADDKRLTMSSQDLLTYYTPYIQKIFPDFNLSIVEDSTVWTAPYAQPIVHKGYRHSIPEIQTPIPNLFCCTMAQIYPNDRQVSNGVEMANKTAHTLIKQMRS